MADKNLRIKVSTKGAKKVKQDLGGVEKRLGSLAKKAAIAGAAFFGARALVSGFKAVIDLAGEQEMAEKKLEAVLKSTSHAAGLQATELKHLASSLQTMTTFGDEAIIGAESLMLTFTNIGKDVFPGAIETVLNMSTAMGTDLQSSVIQLGKALNDPVKGVAALSRVGVQLTDEQISLIKAFDAAGDAAGAQKVILGELETQFGGLAKAAGDTMAGSMEQAKNAIGDTGEAIGSLLAPAITSIADGFKNLAENVGDWIKIPSSEKLDDDRFASERLFNVLEDVNASQQVRSGAIKEINSKYGSYLTNLLTEKSSLKDIQKAQDDINRKMLERIAIEVQREDIADNMREMRALWKEEAGLINAVADAEDHLSAKQTAATISQRLAREQMKMQGEISQTVASANLDMAESYVSFAGGAAAAGSGVHSANVALGNAQEVLDANREKQKELIVQTALLREEQEKLAEAFGFKTDTDKEGGAGKPEIEELIMSEEQKAAIRAEFNQRFLEMTVGQNELQNIELQNATERFREAGVEEVEIAKFVAERKKAIDLEYKNSKISSVGSLMGAFSQLNQASKGSALVSKRLAQGEAAMSTWVAVNKALAAGVPPWNIVQATAIGAMGLANVVKIESQKFAQGGIVPGQGTGDTVPAMLTPGEVILNQAQQENLAGGMGITVNISAPLVDETVVDTIIPAIERAQRLNLA